MQIHRLGPELADAYAELFDTAFADNPWWRGCWCWYYEDGCADDQWDPSDPAQGTRNRERRLAQVAAGEATGLLAMVDGRPVGRVNADLRGRYGNLRRFGAAVEPDDPVVGSVMCFVVHPDHRGAGVGTALLAACDDHLRDLGASVAEAYPRTATPSVEGMPWTAASYKGSAQMYARAGYTTHRTHDGWAVVRKPL